jgi:hypothetical protein
MSIYTYVLGLAVIMLMLAVGLLIQSIRLRHFEIWVNQQFKEISKVTINYDKNFQAIQNFFNQVNGDDVK